MKAPVHVDHLARAERELAIGDRDHGFAHVLGCAPASYRGEAFGDKTIILLFDWPRHVGSDDTGPNFVNANAILGQAAGVERRQHRKSSFGDAIITAVHRRGVSTDGGDRYDLR